jgi:hypothetical protein
MEIATNRHAISNPLQRNDGKLQILRSKGRLKAGKMQKIQGQQLKKRDRAPPDFRRDRLVHGEREIL